MRRAFFAIMPLLVVATTAGAQEDHSAHQGHAMPAAPAKTAAPSIAGDHAADAYYDPAAMARARATLARESGGMPASLLLIDRLEVRPGPDGDGYAWEGEGWIGGDIDRLTIKSEGEGVFGRPVEQAEVQALWSHAIDPWFNLQAGVRQDFQRGPNRTHAILAVEGLAPYWFHVEGAAFLSQRGEVTARAEITYDQRITQRLIAQPSVEANAAAQNVPEIGLGSGLTSVELGLRLRYELVREFAPYAGVNWERMLGGTATRARAEGRDAAALRFVAGLRFWF